MIAEKPKKSWRPEARGGTPQGNLRDLKVYVKRPQSGEWMHVYVWVGPFAVHLKVSQHW